MPRPAEYDNLVRIGQLKDAARDDTSIGQFMQTARDMLVDAQANARQTTRFTLAYEGMFNLVMAVLEHRATRPGDGAGHRAIAIKRVASDLGLSPAQQSVLGRLHDIRNRVTYRQSLPPVTQADADGMLKILEFMVAAAGKLLSL